MNHANRKKPSRKLQLRKQTLARLGDLELARVAGGQQTDPGPSGLTGYCLPTWGCNSVIGCYTYTC
jgi:hypothetical protein